MQLVLTDRSDLTQGQDFGVLSPETWRLADLGAKHALLRAGLGWGSMPEPSVREDIEAGRLVLLDIEALPEVTYNLFAIHRTDTPPGPAARWFLARLAGHTSDQLQVPVTQIFTSEQFPPQVASARARPRAAR